MDPRIKLLAVDLDKSRDKRTQTLKFDQASVYYERQNVSLQDFIWNSVLLDFDRMAVWDRVSTINYIHTKSKHVRRF